MWKSYIQNILPEGTNGVVVVFSSLCGGTFSYRLDGNKGIYLGGGDLHDPQYNYLGTSKTLYDIMDGTRQSAEGSSYSGLPVSKTYCVMTLGVYPSQDFEDDYVTSGPVIFTTLAAFIFIFTSLVFIIYDCTVARRQRIVMQRALASGANVSSLFPEKVKQQLYDEQTQEQKKQNTLKEFMTLQESTDKASCNSSKPIADLFDITTIFFVDLAGLVANEHRWKCLNSWKIYTVLLMLLQSAAESSKLKQLGVAMLQLLASRNLKRIMLQSWPASHAIVCRNCPELKLWANPSPVHVVSSPIVLSRRCDCTDPNSSQLGSLEEMGTHCSWRH
ncbi:Guanylate cyclase [Seminavis robusta]|uniref:Guanylate cyclase n=1 Tax=Seminavis robusta TaxID=568900 RepID=A0A9N8HAK5_9STRA|nr:Guanylate cyclase [Seminavis robusta]|eukprot:Sro300_g111580.1 Guanylate cyclase (331) ;mRNA; f:1864-3263